MAVRKSIATSARTVQWLTLLLWASAAAGDPAPAPLPQKLLRYTPPGLDAAKMASLSRRLASDPALVQRRLQRPREILQQLGPHGVSQKARLRRAERLRDIESGKLAPGDPDTLNVLLIRIAFSSDRSGSLTSITEDGNFLLRAPVDTLDFIDPPPHDKAYFEAHVAGLAEYWNSQSAGRLVVNARVLPDGDEDAYFLSDLADYGPGSGGFWQIEDLVGLVRDMILAADSGTQSDGSVNLAEYDFDDPNTYLIFAHAGGDIQSNLVFEPGDPDYSPNDVPTFFVLLGDEDRVELTSVDPDTGDPGIVSECSVIPESTSQDGLTGSIAAAMYHEFGHALGLPDLYSTQTGLPSLGWWELMDSGTNLAAGIILDPHWSPTSCDDVPPVISVFGLLPPSISAWCKWYLGYADAVVVGGNARDVTLHPSYIPDDRDQILQIDTGGDEFFLVENRYVPPTIPEGEVWSLISDPATGVVQFLGRVLNPGTIAERVENTHMYDFFLPWPGGIFVYRIRQDRIDLAIDYNAVQWTPELAGVTLVEADGIPDIGRFDFYTIGFWGSETDAFRLGSQFTLDGGSVGTVDCPDATLRWPTTRTDLDARTRPSTQSSFGIATGAWLRGIGESQDGPMTLSAGIDGLVQSSTAEAGFPLELPVLMGSDGPRPLRADARSLSAFEFAGAPSIVFAAAAADSAAPPDLFAYGLNGEPSVGGGALASLSANLSAAPLNAAAFAGSGALLLGTQDGVLHAFLPSGGGLEASGFPFSLGDSIDVGPIYADLGSARYAICGQVGSEILRAVDDLGTAHPEFDYGLSPSLPLRAAPILVDLDADAAVDELLYLRGAELVASEIDGTPLPGFPIDASALAAFGSVELLAWPRAGLPDEVAVIAATDSTGRVFRVGEAGGVWELGPCGNDLSSAPYPGSICVDLDGDGERELVVCDRQRVHVRNRAGFALRGWPRRISEEYYVYEFIEEGPTGAPIFADLDADGRRELCVASQLGLLHAYDASGNMRPGFPRRASGSVAAPTLLDFARGGGEGRALLLLEARGDSLSRGGRIRSARLTALDLGEAPADRAAEWTALGGSLARPGRTGLSPSTGAAAAATEPVSIAPNPARDSARIRFFAGVNHVAKLDVYTLEGETVRHQEESVTGGGAREIRFDLRGLVPGPYLCRLRYRGADGSDAHDVLTLFIE